MDEAGVRVRLSHLPPASLLPAPDGLAPAQDGLVPAAVLVAIVLGRDLSVLLTKRAARLTRHAGQVCFPGGRIEPSDASPAEAALREATEEIGLDPCVVSLLGRLPDHVSGSGFRITPVVGLIPAGLHFMPAPAEVATVFALPVATLLDATAPVQKVAERGGKWRTFWVWPHPEHEIWGATAAILLSLASILRGSGGGTEPRDRAPGEPASAR